MVVAVATKTPRVSTTGADADLGSWETEKDVADVCKNIRK